MSLRDLTVQFNEKGFKDLQNKIERIDKNLKKPKTLKVAPSPDSLKQLKSMALRIASIAAPAYAAAKAVKFMTSYIDKAEAVTIGMTKAGGLSAETYQTMQYAADQNNFAITDLIMVMGKLNAIAAKKKDMRSADERLASFADTVASIKDPGQQAAFVLKMLGEGGIKLLPILRQGRAGIAALKERLGDAIIPAEKLERALRFQDMRNRVNEIADAVRNKLADALLVAAEEGGELDRALQDFTKLDFAPMVEAITDLVKLSLEFLGNIIKAVDLWKENRDIKRFKAEEAARYKRPTIGTGVLDKAATILNPELREYLSTDQSKLNIAIDKLNQDLDASLGDKMIKELQRIAVEGLPRQKAEAIDILKRTGNDIAPPVTVKEKDKDKKPPPPPDLGGSQKTANYEDPLLKTVLHFKNEFIVFAQRLLATQNKLVHPATASSYISSIAGSTYNVTVQVQGGGSAEQTGRTVGNEVIEVLRKMHRDTTRAVNDHRTAVVTELKKLTAGEITLASGPAPAPKTTEAG